MIVLNMIVKNEARGIVKTLESVKPFVQRWCICDTGSTDGTILLVKETMKDMPGQLWHIPFIDFATTRNQALKLCEQSYASPVPDYALLLSGDEIVESFDPTLLSESAHDFVIRFGASCEYCQPRLVRLDVGARYVGVTHEYLDVPGDIGPAVGTLYHAPGGTAARWELDRDLLQQHLSRHPRDARAVFYLAQTEHCLGNLSEARRLYIYRGCLDGWYEETYQAWLRAGELGSFPSLLKAHGMLPHRGEPLLAMSRWYRAQGDYSAALDSAERAFSSRKSERERGFQNVRLQDEARAEIVAIRNLMAGEDVATLCWLPDVDCAAPRA